MEVIIIKIPGVIIYYMDLFCITSLKQRIAGSTVTNDCHDAALVKGCMALTITMSGVPSLTAS